MNEWNIQARAHQCQACGKSFNDRQSYHTLLVDLKPDLGRQDVCDACWNREFAGGATDQKGFISYWQGVYEAPPAAPPDPILKENAESLLRKLIELNNPKFTAAGYILAVMLERKRLLKVKEQINRDGHRLFIYEQPKTGDLFTITDPALQLNQLEEVQRVVADLLELGLTPEGQIAYPPPTPPPGILETPSTEEATLTAAQLANSEDVATPPDPEDDEDSQDANDDDKEPTDVDLEEVDAEEADDEADDEAEDVEDEYDEEDEDEEDDDSEDNDEEKDGENAVTRNGGKSPATL